MALLSVPFQVLAFEALAQSNQDWELCKAVDADQIALATCTRLIEANTLVGHDLAVAYYNRGAAHWRQRDSDAAIADEDKAIEIDPNLADAYMRRGVAYWDKGDADRAIADASKAIEIDPENVKAYSNRALARAIKKKDKDLEGAIADTTRAIEINPDFAAAYIVRGIVHQMQHEPGSAYADFGMATSIGPTDGFYGYRLRGLAFRLRNDYRHAIADLARWIEIDPHSALPTRSVQKPTG
jgi:tetratricopeptide (TPR) repeat protein